jgi:AraC-like DNA-binding protein
MVSLMTSHREHLVAETTPVTRVQRSSRFPGIELIWARPTGPYPPHISMTPKVALVSHGAKEYRYRRRSWVAPSESLVFANAGEAHAGCPVGKSYEVLMLSFEPKALDQPQTTFDDIVVTDGALAHSFRSVCAAISGGTTTSSLHAGVVLAELVTRLGQRSASGRPEAPQIVREPTSVRRALEMLRELYAAQLSLDDLVATSRLPKPRFLRAFKEAVGLPPHRYQLQLRVEHAKRLIAKGTPIAEASAATGFFDQSHFHRHFMRIVGVSPGIYRGGCFGT